MVLPETPINSTPVRDLVPFRFQDIQLKEACWMNGKPCFTRRAIGEFLEYAGSQSQKAVDKIIERNPHIRQWSVTVNLTVTDGKAYETEVFDPIGLQLIIFESRQPKARAYKVAVAHLVWAYMHGQLRPPVDHGYGPQLRALDLVPQGQKLLAVDALAGETRCGRSTIYRHRTLLRAGIDPSRKRYPTLLERWERHFPREKALVLAALQQGWSALRVWREVLCASVQPSLHMVRALNQRVGAMREIEGALHV